MRKKSLIKDENGLAVIEATILLPVCIIMVVAVYYASVFLCQKANLQANLENALIYYKNADSDTYIVPTSEMTHTKSDGKIDSVGSKYENPTAKFPYRFFAMNTKRDGFAKFFRSMCGYMFFDTGENVTINVENQNFVIYKTIKATATQTVKPAVSLSLAGVGDSFTISASAEVVITDGDDFIRTTDFAIDIVSKTKVGEIASDIAGKLVDTYNSIKARFGVE